MVVIGEQGEPHVGEDKVLCQEVDQLKQLFGPSSSFVRQVYVRIVGLHNPTEQNCHYTYCVCTCVCIATVTELKCTIDNYTQRWNGETEWKNEVWKHEVLAILGMET